jgi:hypothetical protein
MDNAHGSELNALELAALFERHPELPVCTGRIAVLIDELSGKKEGAENGTKRRTRAGRA